MNSGMILPIVLIIILGIFAIIFLVVTKKQAQEGSINKSENNSKSHNNSNNSNKNEIRKEDIFKFMEFDRIMDNMIVQNNGTKFTMAIKCKGINYDLMSDVEQIAVEEGFITFLNTLRFPIQLYVQAQNIDLKSAINTYKQNISDVKKEYETINDEYSKLIEAFDSTKEDIDRVEREKTKVQNVYEYASDIIQYVERLSLNKSLLQRNFYVLVSYHTSEITSVNNFNKEEIINISYNELLTRAQTIISGLASCSVSGNVLDSNELADLIYTAYNRDDKGLLSVRDALDAGFYRLYSTSEDVFNKKQEMIEEEIRNEAKIKAIESIQQAIKDGTYISPEAEKLDTVEQIHKQAYEYVEQQPLEDDLKEKARQILVNEYKTEKKGILDTIARDNQDILNVDTSSLHTKSSNVAQSPASVMDNKTNTVNNNSFSNNINTNNMQSNNTQNSNTTVSSINNNVANNNVNNANRNIDNTVNNNSFNNNVQTNNMQTNNMKTNNTQNSNTTVSSINNNVANNNVNNVNRNIDNTVNNNSFNNNIQANNMQTNNTQNSNTTVSFINNNAANSNVNNVSNTNNIYRPNFETTNNQQSVSNIPNQVSTPSKNINNIENKNVEVARPINTIQNNNVKAVEEKHENNFLNMQKKEDANTNINNNINNKSISNEKDTREGQSGKNFNLNLEDNNMNFVDNDRLGSFENATNGSNDNFDDDDDLIM